MKVWSAVVFSLIACLGPALAAQEPKTSGAPEKTDAGKDATKGDAKEGEKKPDKDDDIVVTPSRTAEKPKDSTRGISAVNRKDMEKRGPSSESAAELVRGEPGVFLQQTGRRGGAPIIRGMIGKYILPMYDGIRLTDGTIFAGPNAFFNNIDRFTIERVEIVRGPSSLFYGSDALGGTVNMIPHRYDGFPDAFDYGFGIESRFRSVSTMFSERLEFMGGVDRFTFFLGGTFVDSADSRGGGALGRSYNTSWTEFDFDMRIAVKLTEGHVLEAAYLRTEARNNFRYDQPWETPKENAWWKAHRDLYLTGAGLRKRQNKTPQIITQLAYLTYTAERATPFWDEVIARFYWRGQYEKGVRGSEQATTRTENTTVTHQNTYGLSAQFAWQMLKVNKIVYGLDSRLDDVYAGHAFTNLFSKATGNRVSHRQDAPGSPDARYLDIGAFLYDEFKPVKRLTLTAGIRYNYTNLTSRPTELTTPDPLNPHDLELNTDFTSITYSGGVAWAVIDQLTLVANVGTGFKSPSISDTLSSGAFTFGVEVPSPNLRPEQSTTYELGVKSNFDRFSGEALIYYTDLRNLIDSHPGTFAGSDFIDLNGDGMKQNDEQVFVKGNSGRAYLYGAEIGASWEFVRHPKVGSFFAHGNASYTRGYDLTLKENLRFIPPVNGIVSARWELKTKSKYASRLWAEVEVPWSFNKPRDLFAQEDFADLAQFPRKPGNLRGYVVLNLRSGMDVTEYLTLTWSITNLLNLEYQTFGSRLPADGISFDFGLRLRW